MNAAPVERTVLQAGFSFIFTVLLPSLTWFLIIGIIATVLNPVYTSYKRIAPGSTVLITEKTTVPVLVKDNDDLRDRRKKGIIKDSHEHLSNQLDRTTHEIVSHKVIPFLIARKNNDTDTTSISPGNSKAKHLIGPILPNRISIIKKMIFELRNVPILADKVYKIAQQIRLTIIIYISPIDPNVPVNSTRTTTIFTIPATR